MDGCGAKVYARNWCKIHYDRNRRNGHLELMPTRQPVVNYNSAHARIRRDKGPASAHPCVDCGAPATQWAYDGLDPNELTDTTPSELGLRYSLSVDHYQAKCAPCHVRMDRAHRVFESWNYPPTEKGKADE